MDCGPVSPMYLDPRQIPVLDYEAPWANRITVLDKPVEIIPKIRGRAAASWRVALLRRIARRCPFHDRAWPLIIAELEADLGYPPTTPPIGDPALNHADPRIIGCSYPWCTRY